MTTKQCNSCKYHVYEKRKRDVHDSCFHPFGYNHFMRSKNCEAYVQGEINSAKKEFFKKYGQKPSYKFLE